MKRPSIIDGKGQSLAGDVLHFPSLARSAGPSTTQFPGSAAASAGDQEGAGVSPASASSTFDPLGKLSHAVVLRFQGDFPKIRVPAHPGGEPRRFPGQEGDD